MARRAAAASTASKRAAASAGTRPAGGNPAGTEPAAAGQAGSPAAAVAGTHRAIRRYGSVYAAAIAGLVVAGLAFVYLRGLWTELGAIAFFVTYLTAMLVKLPRLTPRHLRSHADESDTPGYVIMVVALATLVAASVSLFVLLNGAAHPDRLHLVLGIVALVVGWLGVHSMLAFHYAYEYYGTDTSSPIGKDGHRGHVGGVDFPGSDAPDALSFLYFSFVVAMTAQVSDVTVTSNGMRRLVLLHGIMAFFFNTVILAVAVNVVVSLGH